MHENTYFIQCHSSHGYLCFSHFHRPENAVRGLSGDPFLCCVKACARCVVHLHAHNAPVINPLATAYINQTPHKVQPKHISKALKDCDAYLGANLTFHVSDVTARCLKASSANALLIAKVNTNIICLIGRWRCNKML